MPGRGCACSQATTDSRRGQASNNSSAVKGRLATQDNTEDMNCRVFCTNSAKRRASFCLPNMACAASSESSQTSSGSALLPSTRWRNSRSTRRTWGMARSSVAQARTSSKCSLSSPELGPVRRKRLLTKGSPPAKGRSNSPLSHSFCTCARRSLAWVQFIKRSCPCRGPWCLRLATALFLPGIPQWSNFSALNHAPRRCGQSQHLPQRAR